MNLINFETYELLKNFRENGVERKDVRLVVNCIVYCVFLALRAHVFIGEEVSQKLSKSCWGSRGFWA